MQKKKKKKKILPTNSVVKLTVEEDVGLVPGILTLMKGVLKEPMKYLWRIFFTKPVNAIPHRCLKKPKYDFRICQKV